MVDFDASSLIRPHLRGLTPYASARDEFSGAAMVFLDANENPHGSVVDAALNRYPDPRSSAVRAALGAWLGVEASRLFVGNGSDEAIDLLLRAFCEPGEHRILITPPTYGMYRVCADVHGVGVVEVNLTDEFGLDTRAVLDALGADCRLVFLCSPNNPTGNLLDREAVAEVAAASPGLVVVDEAYVDFAGAGASMLDLIEQFPNVVVLRTFSKAWGMAAARIGAAIAHPDVVAVLNKIKLPYNLSGLAQEAALAALDRSDRMSEFVARIVGERAWLAEQLTAVPEVVHVHRSDANFLLVRFADARAAYDWLVSGGVIVRDRSRVALCDGALRITIGTRPENEALLARLREPRGGSQP
jgi:histidinol-phosphate aminotransferase